MLLAGCGNGTTPTWLRSICSQLQFNIHQEQINTGAKFHPIKKPTFCQETSWFTAKRQADFLTWEMRYSKLGCEYFIYEAWIGNILQSLTGFRDHSKQLERHFNQASSWRSILYIRKLKFNTARQHKIWVTKVTRCYRFSAFWFFFTIWIRNCVME